MFGAFVTVSVPFQTKVPLFVKLEMVRFDPERLRVELALMVMVETDMGSAKFQVAPPLKATFKNGFPAFVMV